MEKKKRSNFLYSFEKNNNHIQKKRMFPSSLKILSFILSLFPSVERGRKRKRSKKEKRKRRENTVIYSYRKNICYVFIQRKKFIQKVNTSLKSWKKKIREGRKSMKKREG